jgi:hypothetical protein
MDDQPNKLLSDHMLDALVSIGRARSVIGKGWTLRREAVLHELVEAEKSIARVIGLIGGEPRG